MVLTFLLILPTHPFPGYNNKAQKMIRSSIQEIEPNSRLITGVITSVKQYIIKYNMQSSVVSWLSFLYFDFEETLLYYSSVRFNLASVSPNQLYFKIGIGTIGSIPHIYQTQASKGTKKQATEAIIFVPSMTRMVTIPRQRIIETIWLGLTLQFFSRKPRDSCSSIFSNDNFFANLSTIEFILIQQQFNMQMFQEQVAAMNRTYGLFINWPTPSGYNFWYQSLPQEYHPYYATPSDYNLFYYQASKMFSNTAKPPKLSRNQRRKQKLNLLKAELQDQTKKIGNWVKLQRKDLIQNIQRIEKKEQKIKNKRKDKLSHLIQIHREVFKHYKAKCQIKDPKKNRRVDPENNKKRLSFIKRMKVLFQNKIQQNKIQRQKAKATENIVQEEGFLTESESESDKQDEKKVEIKQDVKKKIIQKYSNNDINKIEYSTIGKLTGKNYHEISLREWCKNVPSEQLEDITLQIINRLAYKQAIRKIQKPNKAKKLIVSGIKQCRRTLDTIIDKKRSRILIIALNIQRNNLQKGVDDQVQKNILLAEKINIPIINISTRSKLGRAFTGKFGPRITMLSIINYQGYQDMVQKMLDKWEQGCKQYNRL